MNQIWVISIFSIVVSTFPAQLSSDYSQNLTNWITLNKKTTTNERFAEVTGEKGDRQYYTAAFRTLKYDSARINRALLNFEEYEEIFSSLDNVKKIRRCVEEEGGCWYFELKAFPFRYASIVTPVVNGGVDCSSDLLFNQVEDSELIDKYRKDKNDFFLIKDRGLSICFIIIKIDEQHSRVGVVITSKPDVSIPPWLFKLGTRNIVPGILSDLEKYLKEQSEN